MLKITAHEFAGRMQRLLEQPGQSIVWFLGAGCSISSGIQGAAGLVRKWLRELQELQDLKDWQFMNWVSQEFPTYDKDNPARIYGEVLERLYPSPWDRQLEIERICANCEPNYGYATFAQLITHDDIGRRCNIILTTNFDDLVAESIYAYGAPSARPQIINHESLARFARSSDRRPTILKLHGDAHIAPQNLSRETRIVSRRMAKHLQMLVRHHAVVFLGYGGYDLSIFNFFKTYLSYVQETPPIYWVGRTRPLDKFYDWLNQSINTIWVDHADFDELMHILRLKLSIPHPPDERWGNYRDKYYSSWKKFEQDRLFPQFDE
jgi:hypothetical protein